MLNLQKYDKFNKKYAVDDYVWELKSPNPGPTVMITGLIHGNELAGDQIAYDLLTLISQSGINQGTLKIALGNINAARLGVRYQMELGDLNRSFATETPTNSLQERACLLQKHIKEADLLLDIHNTIKPSDPFIALPTTKNPNDLNINNTKFSAQNILNNFDIKTIITGKGLQHPNGDPIYADTYALAHNGIGMTIEAGPINSPKIQTVQNGVMQTLMQLGLLDQNTQPTIPQVKHQIWNAYWNVIAGNNFKFTKEYGNFEELPIDKPFANDDENRYQVAEQSIILFPKPQEFIKPNLEACIIANATN